jgi:hypothetical protein
MNIDAPGCVLTSTVSGEVQSAVPTETLGYLLLLPASLESR